jgi:TolA-binding protein
MGEPQLTALGRKVAELQDAALHRSPAARLDTLAGRARLLAVDLPGRREPRRAAWTLAFAASFAALVIAVLAGARVIGRRQPLQFALGAESGTVGAWIAASPEAPREIRFSEGSRLELAPGGRARVTSVDEAGAEVALERGALDVSVVHKERTRWTMRGGPFLIRVVGTRFHMQWDPIAERFEVALFDGAIVVSGPVVGDERPIRAGERLVITKTTLEVTRFDVAALEAATRGGSMDTASRASSAPNPPVATAAADDRAPASPSVALAPAGGSPAAGSDVLSASSGPAAPPRDRHAVGSRADDPRNGAGGAAAQRDGRAPPPVDDATPPRTTPRWRELAREAKYKDALAAAELDGFDGLCASAPASELRALADVARLGGGGARTAQAYGALRKRFPGTADAAVAAFILGRMAQDQARDYAHAAGWFVVYLSEQPGGEFAPEAMGRLVEAADRTGDEAGAERAAERYLAAYPGGPHAGYARRVLARRASP